MAKRGGFKHRIFHSRLLDKRQSSPFVGSETFEGNTSIMKKILALKLSPFLTTYCLPPLLRSSKLFQTYQRTFQPLPPNSKIAIFWECSFKRRLRTQSSSLTDKVQQVWMDSLNISSRNVGILLERMSIRQQGNSCVVCLYQKYASTLIVLIPKRDTPQTFSDF